MKTIFFILVAFTLAAPALADSGDVPENFEDAILRESADDQGIDTNEHKKNRQEAVAAKKAQQKNQKPVAKKESVEDFLRRMAMINEIYGEYPPNEEECRKTTDDPVLFEICMENNNPAVLSSNNDRSPSKLKKEIHRGGSEDHKASINFTAE